jgi:hypothetical protein
MPEHPLAILERGRRWLPAFLHSGTQDLVRARYMVPNDDRRYRTESRRPEHQGATAPGNDGVVRKLILNNHVGDHGRLYDTGRLTATPLDHGRQRLERSELDPQPFELSLGQAGPIPDVHGSAEEDAGRAARHRRPASGQRECRAACHFSPGTFPLARRRIASFRRLSFVSSRLADSIHAKYRGVAFCHCSWSSTSV